VGLMKDFIFIYGPPGVGKSTVGLLLASALKIGFIDLDEEIVRQVGKPIAEIFSEDGEPAFRELEKNLLSEIVGEQSRVVALGGGALVKADTKAMVEANGEVVFLGASFDALFERLYHGGNARPLLAGNQRENLVELLSRRKTHYDSFENWIDTTLMQHHEVVWEIQKKLGWFQLEGMGSGYRVRVKNGALDNLVHFLADAEMGRSVCIVTDENVGPLHARRVGLALENQGFKVHMEILPPGEAHKHLATIERLWNTFLDAGMDRSSIVIAVGGGVVSDLAGFAAATYMRGINWVAVPTSLLAMVDASVGGKTGFDLPRGKNLVGAFHPPRFVLVDPDVLSTLPDIERRNGMAEVVKHGVIASEGLFAACGNGWPEDPTELEHMVREALAVKVGVVLKDPYEQGIRAALNLGHTVGHAVEHLSGYQIPHGFAVAIGMAAEARLAAQMGLAANGFVDRLVETLSGLGLPTEIPLEIDPGQIIETMRIDKKTVGGRIKFALPVTLEEVRVGVEADDLEAFFSKEKEL
jgi:shikimate kinase/3-dehydroquinate synthase